MIRSLLIVPACDALAIERALASPADALVIDLAATPAGGSARVVAALGGGMAGRPRLLIRLGSLDGPDAGRHLEAIRPARPDGVVLAGAETAADVQHLGAMLAVEEAEAGRVDGSLRIVALVTTGGGLFGMNALARASPRLDALAWDGEALALDLGAEQAREADGRWCDPCQTARTLTLAGAAHAGLAAIDAGLSSPDLDAFWREAEAARRDGFSAKLALDAAQAAIANEVFGRIRPSAGS